MQRGKRGKTNENYNLAAWKLQQVDEQDVLYAHMHATNFPPTSILLFDTKLPSPAPLKPTSRKDNSLEKYPDKKSNGKISLSDKNGSL